MSLKTSKRDALFGGFIFGGAAILIILVCCLPRRIRRIRHEDISSISRRYQSYQDCARVPYGNGNPPQIDRVDIINVNEDRCFSATNDPETSQQMVCEGGQVVSHDQQCSIGEDFKKKTVQNRM